LHILQLNLLYFDYILFQVINCTPHILNMLELLFDVCLLLFHLTHKLKAFRKPN
jgi:hypothetical protein